MPVTIQCRKFSLTEEEVGGLWLEVVELRGCLDEAVTVRCVSAQEIRQLNKQYRGKDKVTNVLTFSYPPSPPFDPELKVEGRLRGAQCQHDVAVCLSVIERKDVAWVLVHAFLHVAGMDHENSVEEAKGMEKAEAAVLKSRGF